MYPTFNLGLDFPAYFTLLMVGYVLVVRLGVRDAPRMGLDRNRLLDLSLWLIAAGIIGARGLHVFADGQLDDYVNLCRDPLAVHGEVLPSGKKCKSDEQCVKADLGELCHPTAGTCHQGQDCLRAFKFWYGGLTYYGGLGLASLVGILYLRRYKMPLWRVGDLAGFAIPLGLVFGRVGCFLAGCCFGEVCPYAFGGIAFPAGSPAWERHRDLGLIAKNATESLQVWPTQLWEAAACLAIFLFTYFWMRPRRRFDGQIFFVSMMLYAVARFVIEFWRDDPRGGLLGLSTSQLLGFPLFAFGAVMYAIQRRHPLQPPEPPPA